MGGGVLSGFYPFAVRGRRRGAAKFQSRVSCLKGVLSGSVKVSYPREKGMLKGFLSSDKGTREREGMLSGFLFLRELLLGFFLLVGGGRGMQGEGFISLCYNERCGYAVSSNRHFTLKM